MAYSDCQAAARPATVFDQLQAAVGRVGEMSVRIEHLADRLCGDRPPEKTAGLSGGPGSGVFAGLRASAESVLNGTAAMSAALDRIEAQLP